MINNRNMLFTPCSNYFMKKVKVQLILNGVTIKCQVWCWYVARFGKSRLRFFDYNAPRYNRSIGILLIAGIEQNYTFVMFITQAGI